VGGKEVLAWEFFLMRKKEIELGWL